MKRILIPAALILIVLSSFLHMPSNDKVKDFLSVPGPLTYNKQLFSLSWSSHPQANYYKQEYLPAGQKSESFHKMVMIEVVTGDIVLKNAVKAKADELERLKQTNPMVNYQLIENKTTGEYLLDFLISSPAGNNPSVVEWNGYRYMPLKEKNGRKGIQLIAVSKRAYGKEITPFLDAIRTDRPKEITALTSLKAPAVNIINP